MRCLLVLGLLCIFNVVYSEQYVPVPVFMMSQQDLFQSGSSSHFSTQESITTKDLEHVIGQVLGGEDQSKLSKYINTESNVPEVVITFMVEKMSSAQASALFNNDNTFKNIMNSFTSSAIVPFVYPTSSSSGTTSSILNAFSRYSLQAKIGSFQQCSDALSWLQDQSSLMDNNVADLAYIVEEQLDLECIQSLISNVKSMTSNYLIVITSRHTESVDNQPVAKPVQLNMVRAAAAPSTSTGPQYITSNILTGLFVSLFLLCVLYAGINILMGIEDPIRMGKTPLVIAKEY